MRLPVDGRSDATREAADRAAQHSAIVSASPAWQDYRQGVGASSRSASNNWSTYYIDVNGISHKMWVVGVTTIGEDWQIGPDGI